MWIPGLTRAVLRDIADHCYLAQERRRGYDERDQRDDYGLWSGGQWDDGEADACEICEVTGTSAEGYPTITCRRCCRRARGIIEIGGPPHTRKKGCLLRGVPFRSPARPWGKSKSKAAPAAIGVP